MQGSFKQGLYVYKARSNSNIYLYTPLIICLTLQHLYNSFMLLCHSEPAIRI